MKIRFIRQPRREVPLRELGDESRKPYIPLQRQSPWKVGRGHPEPNACGDRDPRNPSQVRKAESAGGQADNRTCEGDRVRSWKQEPGVPRKAGKASAKRAPSRGDEGVTRRKSGSPLRGRGEEVTLPYL